MPDDPTMERWNKLRAEFPPEAHGKLPQPYRKDAEKGVCDDCGKYHGLPAMHIDFIGHAYITERLGSVDPDWTLEPLAKDAFGNPLMIEDGGELGVWACLTVLGAGKIDYGTGRDRKTAWSDALKRTAMRHGIAVEMWQKEGGGGDEKAAAGEAAPEATFGHCPRCGIGMIVKRTKKSDGSAYAKCSLGVYKDDKTCQWVDWTPDFEALATRAEAQPVVASPTRPAEAVTEPVAGNGVAPVVQSEQPRSDAERALFGDEPHPADVPSTAPAADAVKHQSTAQPAAPASAQTPPVPATATEQRPASTNDHWLDTLRLIPKIKPSVARSIFESFDLPPSPTNNDLRVLDEGKGIALFRTMEQAVAEAQTPA